MFCFTILNFPFIHFNLQRLRLKKKSKLLTSCEYDNVLTFCDDLNDNMAALIYADYFVQMLKIQLSLVHENEIRTFIQHMHASLIEAVECKYTINTLRCASICKHRINNNRFLAVEHFLCQTCENGPVTSI